MCECSSAQQTADNKPGQRIYALTHTFNGTVSLAAYDMATESPWEEKAGQICCCQSSFNKHLCNMWHAVAYYCRGCRLVRVPLRWLKIVNFSFAGEVVSDVECERRMQVAKQTGEPHFYMMELSPGLIIDARDKGNVARLINSSCAPNCQSQKWHDAATGVQPPVCCLPKPGHIVGATSWCFVIFTAVHSNALWATAWPIAVMVKLDHLPSDCTQAALPSTDTFTV